LSKGNFALVGDTEALPFGTECGSIFFRDILKYSCSSKIIHKQLESNMQTNPLYNVANKSEDNKSEDNNSEDNKSENTINIQPKIVGSQSVG
jgi:hypothetical protein